MKIFLVRLIDLIDSCLENFFGTSGFIKRHILGYKVGSDPFSNLRRSFSRLLFTYGLLLTILTGFFGRDLFENEDWLLKLYCVTYVIIGIVFFSWNVIWVTFRQGPGFEVNVTRLFKDVILSTLFSVITLSFLFRYFGILGPGHEGMTPVSVYNFRDHLYFAAVTFSTLGYGDFRPSGDSRLIAGAAAMYGNLHLGFLVGVCLLAASKGRRLKNNHSDADQDNHGSDDKRPDSKFGE